ncbi:MAG: hypothetical protein AAFY17_09375 [Cyanobacteria bacterium J06642_11]
MTTSFELMPSRLSRKGIDVSDTLSATLRSPAPKTKRAPVVCMGAR